MRVWAARTDSYDFTGVQKYRSDVVSKNSAGVTYLMKKNKVTVFNGYGKIARKRIGSLARRPWPFCQLALPLSP